MATGDLVAPVSAVRPNFWLIAVLITVVLAALYWFFLRSAYVPVLVNLDPQDAAEIAKVLDKKKIEYRFESAGRTIAVVEAEADRARIELAGSELPMKGQIGFELFNQSDMGLTEFAQKINYQRALQGELARTILLLDGIQAARVHLGLPERSMFRGEQEQPKASVTLILKPGKSLSAATVLGIQRLVAGAVPELPVETIAVLDGTGRVVSPETQTQSNPAGTSDAVVETVRQRLIAAIARNHPDLRFGANVSLRYGEPKRPDLAGRSSSESDAAQASEYPSRGVPDYSYAIRLTSEQPIEEGQRNELQRLVAETLDFDPSRGDTLVFLVGPILTETVPAPITGSSERIVAKAETTKAENSGFQWQDWWLALPLLGVALLGLAYWTDRRRREARRTADLGQFAELLRQRLEVEVGA
ncbi:MAG: flagellar basal-body MS-ring/collar protein FliF [Novosphingobium sp.]